MKDEHRNAIVPNLHLVQNSELFFRRTTETELNRVNGKAGPYIVGISRLLCLNTPTAGGAGDLFFVPFMLAFASAALCIRCFVMSFSAFMVSDLR